MNRTRAWRRAQRDRVVRARTQEIQEMTGRPYWRPAGQLEHHQRGLGCPDGRMCAFCSRPFNRAAQRRDERAEIEDLAD